MIDEHDWRRTGAILSATLLGPAVLASDNDFLSRGQLSIVLVLKRLNHTLFIASPDHPTDTPDNSGQPS